MTNYKDIFRIFKKSLADFKANNPLQLASSTAFFCLFALPPILIILIKIMGMFLKPEMLSSEIFYQLSNTIGEKSSAEIQEIFMNFRDLAEDWITSILVFVFFIFIATNLFGIVRKSINQLWNIKVKKSPGIIPLLKSRLIAMILVMLGGVFILISLLADAMVTFIGDSLDSVIPDIGLPVIKLINAIFSIITMTFWFTVLYKILPNAKINWRPAMVGGFITALLFTIGKFILGKVLVSSNINSIFGASGSIVLILLFIFYSALIFYLGAAYTRNYGEHIGKPIKANKISEIVQ